MKLKAMKRIKKKEEKRKYVGYIGKSGDRRFSPLEGYLNENSYRRVLEECRLETGEVWPMPIVLRVSELDSEKVEVGKELLLRDEEGTILAKVDVESKYEINKEEECEKVVGTNDKNHPYVDMLNKTGKVGVGGKVT